MLAAPQRRLLPNKWPRGFRERCELSVPFPMRLTLMGWCLLVAPAGATLGLLIGPAGITLGLLVAHPRCLLHTLFHWNGVCAKKNQCILAIIFGF